MTLRTLATNTDPVLRAIMSDETPPAERARIMAQQLNGKLEAGNLRRLPICELVDLRGLVWGLDSLADQLERPAIPARRNLWKRIFG